ncbi:unnamed protein product [Closterium sp. NIES-64]|nr:unnamed protein product [Closterium sp. NIES-64]
MDNPEQREAKAEDQAAQPHESYYQQQQHYGHDAHSYDHQQYHQHYQQQQAQAAQAHYYGYDPSLAQHHAPPHYPHHQPPHHPYAYPPQPYPPSVYNQPNPYQPPPQPAYPPAQDSAFPANSPLAAFFDPREPPPAAVAAPASEEVRGRVEKAVEYAAKNGPQFEALMRDKQRGQPAYAFLEAGGEGADYYRFRLWCALSGSGAADAVAWTEGKSAADGQAEQAVGKQGEADGEHGSAEVKVEGEQEGEKQAVGGAPGAQQAQTGSEAPPAVPLPSDSTPPLPPEPPLPPMPPPPADPADVALQAAVAAAGLPADVGGRGGGAASGAERHEGGHQGRQGVGGVARGHGVGAAHRVGAAGAHGGAGRAAGAAAACDLPRQRRALQQVCGQRRALQQVCGQRRALQQVCPTSLQQRPQPGAVDAVAAALQPCLGFMLAALFHGGGDAQSSNQERLGKILAFWASKEVYPGEAMAHLGALMRLPPHQHPPMPPPPPVPAMDYHAAGEWRACAVGKGSGWHVCVLQVGAGVTCLACVIQALSGSHPHISLLSFALLTLCPLSSAPLPLSHPHALPYPSATQPYAHGMHPHAPPPPAWPPLPPHMPPMPHDAAAPASAPVPATPPSFPPPPAPATQPPHQPSPAPVPSAPPEPQPPTPDAPPAAPAPTPAEKAPYPLFPPGLIPGMVRKKQVGSGVPYAPMAPHDIPSTIPPPHESEEYLRAPHRRFFKAIGETDPLAEGDEDEEEDAEEADGGRGILGGGIGKRGHGHGGHGVGGGGKRGPGAKPRAMSPPPAIGMEGGRAGTGHGRGRAGTGHGGSGDWSGHGGSGDWSGHGGSVDWSGHGGERDWSGHGGSGDWSGHGGAGIGVGMEVDPETGMLPDGSVVQKPGMGGARLGLGAAVEADAPSQYADVYSSFRRMLSSSKGEAMAAPASNPSNTVTNISEFQCLAKEKLPKQAYDYYASGAEDQWTLAENRNAFERIRFRPRILIDVSSVDTTTSVLGHRISMPIMLAPTAFQRMAHPEGELATARAAAKFDTAMVLSSWATSSVEEVASVGPGLRFFQLYVYKDRQVVEQLVRRAERAGFKAIALTVDTPRLGRREADIKKQSQESGLSSYVAGQIDRSLSWKDIAWLKSITSLPILVKGVITAEDAEISIEYGAAGIIVSNHGARQLDYVSATICALEEYPTRLHCVWQHLCPPPSHHHLPSPSLPPPPPSFPHRVVWQVVKAARGRVPVFLDGGVRRGTDVLKALALGAAGVFVGRPVPFALAVDGQAGVEKLLGILKDEFELALALAGCTRVADIKRCHVETEEDRLRKAITSRL